MCMNTHLCTSIGCNQLMTNNPLSSIIWVIDKKIVQMSFFVKNKDGIIRND